MLRARGWGEVLWNVVLEHDKDIYAHKPATWGIVCKGATQDQANQNSMAHEVDDLQVPVLTDVLVVVEGGKADSLCLEDAATGRISI